MSLAYSFKISYTNQKNMMKLSNQELDCTNILWCAEYDSDILLQTGVSPLV